MRTAPKVLAGAICLCALPYAGYRIAVHHLPAPEPVLLACPDVTAIPETRWNERAALPPAWPVPPEATPIPAPRRSVQRKRNPLIPAPVPVEQCAFPAAGAPGLESNGEPNLVPEPSGVALAGLGLAALAIARARRA
jgi:hypothetical protein